MADKYKEAELPRTMEECIKMEKERLEWAKEARSKDMHGTAHELELTAKLLQKYGKEYL